MKIWRASRGRRSLVWQRSMPAISTTAVLVIVASSSAWADKVGAWETMFAQGTAEASNTNAHGDSLTISCGDPMGVGQIARVEIYPREKNRPRIGPIVYSVDGRRFVARSTENQAFLVDDKASADSLIALQNAMMAGKSVTVTLSDNRAMTFQLRGTKRAFHGEPCKPVYGVASQEPPQALAPTKVAPEVYPICRSRWPDDFVMQKHCQDEQLDALANVFATQTAYSSSPTMRKIFRLCNNRWAKTKASTDYVMTAHCIAEQAKAAAELMDPQ